MAVVSVIVQAIEAWAVSDDLASIENVSVFGTKEDQIVAVIEGDSLADVESTIGRILEMEGVSGVYPVFAGGYE